MGMGGRKRGRETSTGDLARNPGTHPDQESNWQPFSLWYKAQPTEPHQSQQDKKDLKK